MASASPCAQQDAANVPPRAQSTAACVNGLPFVDAMLILDACTRRCARRAGSRAQLQFVKPLAYSLLNLVSASGIVFANKSVFQHYDFRFTNALTLIHTLTTLVGMRLFAYYGAFPVKRLPARATAPLAAAYVGYIVLCNLNLKINSVSFYQVRSSMLRMLTTTCQCAAWT